MSPKSSQLKKGILKFFALTLFILFVIVGTTLLALSLPLLTFGVIVLIFLIVVGVHYPPAATLESIGTISLVIIYSLLEGLPENIKNQMVHLPFLKRLSPGWVTFVLLAVFTIVLMTICYTVIKWLRKF